MTIKIQGDKITFPDDSEQTTAYDGSSGGGIPEAPIDGKQYGRQDANWTEVTGGGGETPSPVSFQAYCSTDAQVFANGVTAQVGFDVFEWDTNSGFDSATSSYTPNVAGYYQVNASVMQQNDSMVRGTTSIWKNESVVASASNSSKSGLKTNAPVNTVAYCNGVDDKLLIKFNPTMSGGTGTAQIANNSTTTYFNATLMQGVSGSGGGGSTPTPEALVWEDKLTDRTWDTKYTNTNDVPMYVMVSTACASPSSTNFVELYIDDISVGRIGGRADSIQDTDTFLIPSGSTYEFKRDGGGVSFYKWSEAKMPLAIAVGGSGGGGTPEPMVWEDVTADRALDTVYTNTNDVPLYFQLYTNIANDGDGDNNYVEVLIDDISFGVVGGVMPVDERIYDSNLFIVPSGSTYKVREVGNLAEWYWKEAKMPVAVGTGGSGGGTPSSFARIVDKKAKTVAGGSSIAGTQNRDLNTIEYDGDNIVTLVDNDFTLQAGTYVINYSAPANRVGAHNVSLYDYTDSQYVNTGTVNYTLDNASNTSYGNYSVTLTEPHTYAVTHTTEEAKAGSGLGNLNPVNDGIFTTVDIQKVGTGGGSGGGSYTPEPMVWEDKLADREGGVVYTNDYDSPLQVSVYANATGGGQSLIIYIDGNVFGRVGSSGTEQPYIFTNFTVPSNSTYTVEAVDSMPIIQWHEAKMPVAVGGDSIWTKEDGKAVYDGQVKATYDNSEAQSNTAQPKTTMLLKNPNGDDGTGDNNYTSLGFDVADGATSQGFITYSRGGDHKGKFVFSQRTGGDTYASQMVLDGEGFVKLLRDGQEINLNPSYGGVGGNAIIESNDPIGLMSNSNLGLVVKTDGSVDMPSVYDGFNTSNSANIYMSSDGKLHRSTTATYSTEEVDKKLAIKDKLIEKLSARLDKLEKRIK